MNSAVLDGHARGLAAARRGVEAKSLDGKEYFPYYLTSLPREESSACGGWRN
ncbi:hypothetical protein HMPREF9946_00724 [Acetobacteraceae bacterium AT-5844]|nr:hypothetical protein HMPREF9946_00724 [Acetobacteraceae bacterium AT-5844]